MMHIVFPRTWREEFAFVATAKREELLQKERLARFEAQQRQQREDREAKEEISEADAWMLAEAFLASPTEVTAFRVQLDEYDARTVEALMENQEALDRIREKTETMLGEAHILPDGRRVFKTKDGQRVFDENGQQVSPDIVDPDSIDDTRPKWEPFKALLDETARLDAERQGLLDYQEKLDHARERLDKDDITQNELEALKDDLSEAMPDAVRRKIEPEKPETEASQEFAANKPDLPNDMDALMRQTGFGQGSPGL